MVTGGAAVRSFLREDGVLQITIAQPPSNALTGALQTALLAAFASAEARGARAVVLGAEGRHFSISTGLEPREAGLALAKLCQVIEDLPLPVVVALKGIVSGPAADLALAAHGRVARADLRFSFPEIGLGLVPQGGATQRLPRLIGMAQTLALLLSARALAAEEGLEAKLIDALLEGDDAALLESAARFALTLGAPRPVRARNEGLLDFAANQAALSAARAEVQRSPMLAPERLIDCLEAALVLPFESGLALEAVTRQDLETGAEAQALVALALAERRAAALPPAVAEIRPKVLTCLGLSGAGPQMAPLAAMALTLGLEVHWLLPDAAARAANAQWLADWQAGEQRAGRLSQAQYEAQTARLRLANAADILDGVEMVIHAAAGEDFERLSRWLPQVPHLVSGGGEGALGLSLAPSMRVAELAVPPQLKAADLALAVQLLRRLGLVAVIEGALPMAGRRVAQAGRRALQELQVMGVPPRAIAAALDRFGHAVPDLADLAPPQMRAMPQEEILRRWLGAMAQEGMRLLEEGVALRPSDIDLVMVLGFGFPRWRGGPMHEAGQRGLMVLRRDLRKWVEAAPPGSEAAALWAPNALLDRLIAEGIKLADLDQD
ncbi:enoyl-CoA hydratase-related protein [Xinfangfangia sp. CPCC 101601]|uniref:Enoyl-CoA hydratase-related protein n=1 Tax=Pseudogemmobacter lacusdianii TaxID=3069608 RepID=A0ABU0VYH1_9RHOB|nr:enoyl-CoA hydratase/isomerase family protein [Xinfangfangia sp. CPCC 101601]MDQ2066764.1 enoyl-CoA hydratase-related protein [Xinfangfangia sp. CPCC 101601]